MRKGIACLVAFSMAISGFSVDVSAASKVRINKKKITIQKGKTFKLKVKKASGVKLKRIKFACNDPAIASVSKAGVVKGKKAGKTRIYVQVKWQKKSKKKTSVFTVSVTVKKKSESSAVKTIAPTVAASASSSAAAISTKQPGSASPVETPVASKKPTTVSSNPAISIEPVEESGAPVVPTRSPEHKHVWQEVVVESATCTKAGISAVVCSQCEEEKERKEIPAFGHNYVETEHVDPWCLTNGRSVWVCQNCGDVVEQSIDYLGHDVKDGFCNRCSEDVRHDITLRKGAIEYFNLWNDGNVEIPETLSDENGFYKVVGIGDDLFANTSVKTVKLPESVGVIGDRVFSNCTSMESISVPISVAKLGNSVFEGCTGLKKCILPYSISVMGDSVFKGCSSLTSVNLPYSLTSVPNETFDECSSLVDFEFPEGVVSIGDRAFANSGVQSLELPACVASIGVSAFEDCKSFSKFNGSRDLNSIGNRCFAGCSDLTVADVTGAKVVGDSVFDGCSSLSNVVFSNDLTEIGKKAFSGCSSLLALQLPNGLLRIGDSAFSGNSGLVDVSIPVTVTEIGECAFEDCGIYKITIPDRVSCIAEGTFRNCKKLTSVTIGSGVKSIERQAFEGCKVLKSAELPVLVESIGQEAFGDCIALETIGEHKGLKVIETRAFYNTPMLSIDFNSGNVTKIGYRAFCKSGLKSVSVERKVVYLMAEAFNDCVNLSTVVFDPDGSYYNSLDSSMFAGSNSISSFTIGDGLTGINSECFKDRQALTEFKFSGRFDKFFVGSEAFSGCENLSVEVPAEVKGIGKNAFYNVSELKYSGDLISLNNWGALKFN